MVEQYLLPQGTKLNLMNRLEHIVVDDRKVQMCELFHFIYACDLGTFILIN